MTKYKLILTDGTEVLRPAGDIADIARGYKWSDIWQVRICDNEGIPNDFVMDQWVNAIDELDNAENVLERCIWTNVTDKLEKLIEALKPKSKYIKRVKIKEACIL